MTIGNMTIEGVTALLIAVATCCFAWACIEPPDPPGSDGVLSDRGWTLFFVGGILIGCVGIICLTWGGWL